MSGSFRIYQDPGYPWYVFELKSDSIYEKIKLGSTETDNYSEYDNSTDAFRYSEDFVISDQPIFRTGYRYLEANLLSNIDNESNCFSLAYRVNPYKDDWCDPDWSECCDKMILRGEKIFCLKQPEEVPEQNSIGDNL